MRKNRFIAYPLANYWGVWDIELEEFVSPSRLKLNTGASAQAIADRYNAKYAIFSMYVGACDDVELLVRELASRQEGSIAHQILSARLDEIGQ